LKGSATGPGRLVQLFFAERVYPIIYLPICGAKVVKHFTEWKMFVLLIKLLVDLIIGQTWWNVVRFLAAPCDLDQMQEMSMPRREVGQDIFDGPLAIDTRLRHLFLIERGQ